MIRAPLVCLPLAILLLASIARAEPSIGTSTFFMRASSGNHAAASAARRRCTANPKPNTAAKTTT